ncbi:hypothetical protein GGF40_003570 [Coemansia sp. RSA 1286]|nr:hypothetical protein GGF40_003570 [Coemansia sp. RSA 1286]
MGPKQQQEEPKKSCLTVAWSMHMTAHYADDGMEVAVLGGCAAYTHQRHADSELAHFGTGTPTAVAAVADNMWSVAMVRCAWAARHAASDRCWMRQHGRGYEGKHIPAALHVKDVLLAAYSAAAGDGEKVCELGREHGD